MNFSYIAHTCIYSLHMVLTCVILCHKFTLTDPALTPPQVTMVIFLVCATGSSGWPSWSHSQPQCGRPLMMVATARSEPLHCVLQLGLPQLVPTPQSILLQLVLILQPATLQLVPILLFPSQPASQRCMLCVYIPTVSDVCCAC